MPSLVGSEMCIRDRVDGDLFDVLVRGGRWVRSPPRFFRDQHARSSETAQRKAVAATEGTTRTLCSANAATHRSKAYRYIFFLGGNPPAAANEDTGELREQSRSAAQSAWVFSVFFTDSSCFFLAGKLWANRNDLKETYIGLKTAKICSSQSVPIRG